MARPVCRKRGTSDEVALPRAHRPDAEHTNPQVTAGELGSVPTPHGGILAGHGGEEVKTVLLVRHGETAWNRDHRLQGWAPVQLSERGREQARSLADGLADRYEIDAVTTSDLPRTRETAEILARALDVDVTTDEGWRERDFGVLQGLTYEAFDERHPDYSLSQAGEAAIDARPEDGESLADLRDRVLDAWDRLVADTRPDETHLVVTHGGPLYLVLGHLLDRSVVESVLESSQSNCAVNEVRVDGDEVEVVRENDSMYPDDGG